MAVDGNSETFNDLWMFIEEETNEDEKELIKNQFRAEPGQGIAKGLSKKQMAKCKSMYQLKELLHAKGLIEPDDSKRLIEVLRKAGLEIVAKKVEEFEKKASKSEGRLNFTNSSPEEMHCRLIEEICQNFTEDEFDSLITVSKPLVSKHNLERPESMREFVSTLQKFGLIKIGDYQKLHELFEKANLKGKSSDLRQHENEIKFANLSRKRKVYANNSSASLPESKNPKLEAMETDCYRHSVGRCYEKKSTYPGLVLIINQFTEERQGTMEDESGAVELFESMNFQVLNKHDLSSSQFLQAINEVKEILKSKQHDSFILIILSHGDQHGIKTCTADGSEEDNCRIKVEDLQKSLNATALPEMAGKPKILLIQACRGRQTMEACEESDDKLMEKEIEKCIESDNDAKKQIIPAEADFVIAYSQSFNFLSYRDTHFGSWFIQTFIKILVDYKHCHLLDILTMVNDQVSSLTTSWKKKQMPVFSSTLRKFYYFT